MYFLLINPKEQPKPKAPLLLASTVKTVFAVSTNKLLLFQAIHIVIVLIYFFSLEYVRNKEHPVPQILCSCPVLHALEGKKKKRQSTLVWSLKLKRACVTDAIYRLLWKLHSQCTHDVPTIVSRFSFLSQRHAFKRTPFKTCLL